MAEKAAGTEQGAVFGDIDALTQGTPDARGDAYQRLMQRETRVLRTVDRVVNAARASSVERESFYNLSLREVAHRFVKSMHGILDDVMAVRHARDVPAVFLSGDRKIYSGLLLVLVSLALYYFSASAE